MNNLIFLIPAVIAFVVYKANTWNAKPSLFAAQQRERANAEHFVEVLTRYFDVLDTEKTGLLTRRHLLAVNGIAASDSDKAWLRAALSHTAKEEYLADNPWLFGPLEKYDFTAIGHIVGRHQETRTAATGTMYGGVVVPYEVWIDDYAISREDLASYVSRVKARRTLPAV